MPNGLNAHDHLRPLLPIKGEGGVIDDVVIPQRSACSESSGRASVGRLPTRGLPMKFDDLLWEHDMEELFYRMLLKGGLVRNLRGESSETAREGH